MLEPTPLLRPSPLDIADLFSGSFAVLKARFGTFALITLFPVLVLLVAATGALISVGALLPEIPGIAQGGQLSPAPLAGYLGSLLVASIIQPLIALKANAMMVVGTYETAQGQSPTVGGLWRGTSGFLLRIFPLVLILALIVVVLYGAMIAAVVAAASTASTSERGAAAIGVVVLFALLVLVVGLPLMIFIGIRLLYLVPVIGIEKLSSFAGLKRAWSLTGGAFWRTLGHYLLAVLVVQGVSMLVSSFVQAGMVPALGDMQQGNTPAEIQAMFAVLLPAYVIALAAQSLVQIMATPFQNAYVAIMYLDQRRRLEEPSAPAPSYGWAPPPMSGGWQQGPPNQGWTPPPPPPSWNPPAPPPPNDGRPGPS